MPSPFPPPVIWLATAKIQKKDERWLMTDESLEVFLKIRSFPAKNVSSQQILLPMNDFLLHTQALRRIFAAKMIQKPKY
ncbi:MAG: hypothetical protein IJV36_02705 [Prevotella sp.]|nr:hypothetical protein [Prevotella sp.]